MRWRTKKPARVTHFVDDETGRSVCALSPQAFASVAIGLELDRDPSAHLCSNCKTVLRRFEHPAADDSCSCGVCTAHYEEVSKQRKSANEKSAKRAARRRENL